MNQFIDLVPARCEHQVVIGLTGCALANTQGVINLLDLHVSRSANAEQCSRIGRQIYPAVRVFAFQAIENVLGGQNMLRWV